MHIASATTPVLLDAIADSGGQVRRLTSALASGMRTTAAAAAIAAAWTMPVHAQWTTPPVEAPGVSQHLFESEAAGTTVSYHVWLPPEYELEPERRFPTLYWLHGSGAAVASIAPISGWFADAIEADLIPPMIVVMPNGMNYRMWCNGFDGVVPMETVVLDELLPEVDANLRTIPSRRARIVEGFSMGGQGAARFGFRRPDLFAGISILGAGPLQDDFMEAPKGGDIPPNLRELIFQQVFGGSAEYYTLQHPRTVAEQNLDAILEHAPFVRQAVGTADFLYEMNVSFHEDLEALGVPHSFLVAEGVDHSTPALFEALGDGNWTFYNDLFGDLDSKPADLDGSGAVNGADLSILLAAWGTCGDGTPCPADLDGDGTVNGADLTLLLAAWE
jgi:enterochelin esterase-like enzyme